MNGMIYQVNSLGLIYAFGKYEVRLKYAKEKLHEHRIFTYLGREVIIIETLPVKNKFTIIVTDINNFDWKKEVNVIDFFDQSQETEYILN